MLWNLAKGVLGGLTLGFGIAFLLGFGLFYLWPEVISPSLSEWTDYETAHFKIIYRKGTFQEEIGTYARIQEKKLTQILQLLNITDKIIPGKIHLYLYKNISALKTGISRRQSLSTVPPLVLLDAIYGEDITAPLTLLVTEFGWGKGCSKLLELGLINYLENPEGEYHLKVQALEEKEFLSLSQLLLLENHDKLPTDPHIVLYEEFNSPNASLGSGLSTLGTLLRTEKKSNTPLHSAIMTEASSLVAFLIEKWEIDQLKELWRSRDFTTGIESTYGLTLSELENLWRKFVQEKTHEDQKLPYLTGANLLHYGKYSGANYFLQKALKSSDQKVQAEASITLGIMNFYLGEFSKARKSLTKLSQVSERNRETQEAENSLKRMLSLYSNGTVLKGRDFIIHAPSGEKWREITDQIKQAVKKILGNSLKLTGLDRSVLPEKFVIVIQSDELDDVNLTQDLLVPQGVIFTDGKKIKQIGYKVARIIASYITQVPTRSALLFEGLTYHLANFEEDIFHQATEALINGKWIPLLELSTGIYQKSLSKVERAAFVRFWLQEYGWKSLKAVWGRTSPLGEDQSILGAVKDILGLSFEQVENNLKSYLMKLENI